MEQFKCMGCSLLFSSKGENSKHQLKCKNYLLKTEPSFKVELSKKKRRARASVQGTYEWALRMPLPKNSKKSLLALDQKYSRVALEKVVHRLEREIAFGESVLEKCLNRQIVASRVLKAKIEIASRLKVESHLQQKRSEDEKRAKERAKSDKAQGSALGGVFDSKYSPFVSGGAPGLGKRS